MSPVKSNSRKMRKEGWRTGSVEDFLKLSDQEAALVEKRVASGCNPSGRRPTRAINRKAK